MTTIHLPRDAAAVALGADEVADLLAAAATQRGRAPTVVRNGTRGMLWLEPMLEVTTAEGRIAFGPVGADDVDGLVAAGLLEVADTLPEALRRHPLHLGPTEIGRAHV